MSDQKDEELIEDPTKVETPVDFEAACRSIAEAFQPLVEAFGLISTTFQQLAENIQTAIEDSTRPGAFRPTGPVVSSTATILNVDDEVGGGKCLGMVVPEAPKYIPRPMVESTSLLPDSLFDGRIDRE